MATSIEINGKKLLSIKEAAAGVKYTRDYVARLAREGKIVASQIGRQWFVDVESLQKFTAEADMFEEIRKKDLRAERKRELMAKDCLADLDQVLVKKIHDRRLDALAMTCAVMCLGLLAGVGIHTATNLPQDKLANIYRSFSGVSVPAAEPKVAKNIAPVDPSPFRPINEPKDTLLLTTVMERPVFLAESEVAAMDGGLSGVLVLAQGGEVKTESEVEALFSDEVEVTFTTENAGVISYERASGETVEYPFVSVPTE